MDFPGLGGPVYGRGSFIIVDGDVFVRVRNAVPPVVVQAG